MTNVMTTTTTLTAANQNYLNVIQSVTEVSNNFLELPLTPSIFAASLIASNISGHGDGSGGSNRDGYNDKFYSNSYDENYSTSVYDFIGGETTFAYGGNTSTNSR